PYFQIFWDRRLRALKAATESDLEIVDRFWNGFLDYSDWAQNWFDTYTLLQFKGDLSLEEGGPFADGEIINFLNALKDAGYDGEGEISFWQKGPSQTELNNWLNDTEDTYSEDYLKTCGYDEVDYAADKFNDFIDTVRTIEKEKLQKRWEYWLGWFYQDSGQQDYDAGTDNSYFAIFKRIVNGEPSKDFLGIYNWIGAINNVENKLGECRIDSNGNIANAPCKHSSPGQPDYYATIDKNTDDEFAAVRSRLYDIASHVLRFNGALWDLNRQINETMEQAIDLRIGNASLTGTNPITYSWSDSLGSHKVIVEVSNFNIPRTKTVERGNWWSGQSCTVMKKYKDETGENTWVRIRREDPDNRQVGILGFWRSGDAEGAIERTAHAAYSYDYVKLVK
ncbi:MAG: hypothetical protein PHY46_02780, partial [Candidatus Omnitrophica bacterium]|nr:hypothetical protein [Candidatus Omnitrophota bacterium]